MEGDNSTYERRPEIGDSEPDLQKLVGDYIDRLNGGERLNRYQILAEQPYLGPEIIEHLESFIGFDEADDAGSPLGTLGDYTLRRQIGRGGMGVVYDAWQNSMDRRVALKVLPGAVAADDKAFNRFMREARAAGKLSHPNVVAVHAMGQDEKIPYYAMEYIEGETLAQILARLRAAEGKEEEKQKALLSISRLFGRSESAEPERPTQDVEEAEPTGKKSPFGTDDQDIVYYGNVAKAFAGVAEGLQHAHSRRIIHRDIKPSNLILDTEGRLRILDFGLARLEGQESLTVSGDFVGTPLYMSPEQARQRKIPIDHRTDVYSLGATMYEMLTCRPPFKGKDHADTLSQIVERDPVEPRKLNPHVPKDLETIVLKCLRKDPGDRYGTAEALSQDLRRFVRGDPIEARPQSAWEKLARRAWRHKTRVGTIACVLLLLVTSAVTVWQYVEESHRKKVGQYEQMVRDAASGQLLCQMHSEQDVSGALGRGILHDLLGARPGLHPVEQTLEKLTEAAALFPERVEAHYYSARGNLFQRRDHRAAEDLRRALACDGDFVPALLLEASMCARAEQEVPSELRTRLSAAESGSGWRSAFLASQHALAEKRYADAEAAYGELIAMERGDREPYLGSGMDAWMGRGMARLEGGDFHGAIQDFVVARYRWPDHPEPTLFLGKAYYLAGIQEQAERILAGLYEGPGQIDQTALAIAAVYRDVGAYDEALAWIERIQDDYLRYRSEAIVRACIVSSLENSHRALTAGIRALLQHPDDSQLYTYLRLAAWVSPRKTPGEHRSACRRLLEENPENASAHVLLGSTEVYFRNFRDAFRLCKRAIELDETNLEAYLSLSHAYAASGQSKENGKLLEKLLTDFAPAVERQEDRPWYARLSGLTRDTGVDWAYRYAQIAEIFIFDQHKYGRAREVCEEALKLNPRSLYATVCLGAALSWEGKMDRAAAVCEEAVKIYPVPVTYCNLGIFRGRLHEFAASLDAYRAVIEAYPTFFRIPAEVTSLFHLYGHQFDESALDRSLALVGALVEGEKRPYGFGYILDAFAGLLSRHPLRDAYLSEAIRYASLGVEQTKRQDPDAVAALARLLKVTGENRQAITLMEEALTLPHAKRVVVEELAKARKEILPILLSYASADAALASLDRRELVPEEAEWRFFRGMEETSPPLEWTRLDFDHSAWETRRTGSAHGDDNPTSFEDMKENNTTLYVRTGFIVPEPGLYQELNLSVCCGDGFVAYLNGEEIGRAGVAEDETGFSHDAVATTDGPQSLIRTEIELAPGCLRPGENVLALRVLKGSRDSSGFSFTPVLIGRMAPNLHEDRKLLEAFRSTVENEENGKILAYLEGRIFQRAGKHRQAAERFSQILEDERPEPHLRYAESLRDAGDPEAAVTHLRDVLSGGFAESKSLWDLWFSIALSELHRTPREMLTEFPRAIRGERSYADAIHWLVETLANGEAVRINCGGDSFRDSSGRPWGRDCFFGGGYLHGHPTPFPFPGDIAGTENDALYQTNRWFPSGESAPPGYRIPVRRGRYRVTLHFAETYFFPKGQRRFHVEIEDKRVLEDYDCRAEMDYATADTHTFTAHVTDGFLDIFFIHVVQNPLICGIEIEGSE